MRQTKPNPKRHLNVVIIRSGNKLVEYSKEDKRKSEEGEQV